MTPLNATMAILKHLKERLVQRAPSGWHVDFEPGCPDYLRIADEDAYQLQAWAIRGNGHGWDQYRRARVNIDGPQVHRAATRARGELVDLIARRVEELADRLFPPRHSELYARLRRSDPAWRAHA